MGLGISIGFKQVAEIGVIVIMLVLCIQFIGKGVDKGTDSLDDADESQQEMLNKINGAGGATN